MSVAVSKSTTRPSLSLLYDELNRGLFRGRLPGYRVRRRTFTRNGQRGECDSATKTIYLARGLREDLVRRVLLHEMCHIGSRGHGQRFLAKLGRLADQGETWAAEERQQYLDGMASRTPLSAQVRQAMEDISWEHPALSWRGVRRLLLSEVVGSAARLRRVAPWAPRVWMRLRVRRAEEQRMHEASRRKQSAIDESQVT